MSSYLPPEPENSHASGAQWGSPQSAGTPPTLPLPQGMVGSGHPSRDATPVFDSPAGYGPGAYGTPPSGAYAPLPGPPQHLPYAGYAPPPGYALTPTYAAQPGYLVAPGFILAADPGAPFGRDPYTREPLSDKSKVGAGLLQLFLGTLGIGRFYIGSSGVGAAQLILTLVGFATAFLGIGVVLIAGVSLWAFIDAIMMLTGGVRDSRGFKLRS